MNHHKHPDVSFETVLYDLYDRLFGTGQDPTSPLVYRSQVLTSRGAGDSMLEQAIRQRRSVRSRSDVTMSITTICEMLLAALGVTSIAERPGYAIPSAGAVRELRYVICVRGEPHPRLFEFVPESGGMTEFDGIQFDEIALEEWERDSIFNLIYCYAPATRRSYANNLLHLAFEAGCASQNIALLSAQHGAHHCVSGIINVRAFRGMFGYSLVPLHMISVI